MENFKLHGSMIAQLIKPNGMVITTRKDNMIVDAGFDFIANSIGSIDNRPDIMRGIGVGTGTKEVEASNVRLQKELLYKVATFKHLTGTKIFSFETTFEPGEATGALTEAGVMSGSGGTLLDRVNFAVINKDTDDKLTVTFNFTMS